ncbi:SMI1 / KNR4 family protein [compost metagenome]
MGVRFPEAFRERLRRQNGGELVVGNEVWIVHPVFDSSDRKRVGRTANHILRETEAAREWPGFPSGAIAVAENGTGDRLVFLSDTLGQTALGSTVYHWEHEGGTLEPVAQDFAELAS